MPFSFSSAIAQFRGRSVSGGPEHQAKRSVPLWPGPLSHSRAAGVRVEAFRLVAAHCAGTAVSACVATPDPRRRERLRSSSSVGVRVDRADQASVVVVASLLPSLGAAAGRRSRRAGGGFNSRDDVASGCGQSLLLQHRAAAGCDLLPCCRGAAVHRGSMLCHRPGPWPRQHRFACARGRGGDGLVIVVRPASEHSFVGAYQQRCLRRTAGSARDRCSGSSERSLVPTAGVIEASVGVPGASPGVNRGPATGSRRCRPLVAEGHSPRVSAGGLSCFAFSLRGIPRVPDASTTHRSSPPRTDLIAATMDRTGSTRLCFRAQNRGLELVTYGLNWSSTLLLVGR